MNIDSLHVRELLGNLSDALRKLREFGQLSEADFLDDYRNIDSAKYLLIVGITAAIDLCTHIAARSGGRAPQDYADCFAIIVELEILDPDLSRDLQQVARVRNLLVHLYGRVDNRRVYWIVQDDLEDLDSFQQVILDWLEG